MTSADEMHSLGILTVATNIYIKYWREMALSLDPYVNPGHRVVLHVFTNQIEEVASIRAELKNLNVVAHEIPNYKWPEATLLRYKIFSEAADEIPEEILMHLDADMLINKSPLEVIFNASRNNSICLVSHPGYWRPIGLISRANFYQKNFSLLLRDIQMFLVVGGLGSWERNRISTAFVRRKDRRNYVCGGTWFGQRHHFLIMVSELSQSVNADLEQNIIAIWHDESHLNSWASKNKHLTLTPEFCHVESYPQLKDLIATITAVDKTVSTR
jgi:hypothetical protein